MTDTVIRVRALLIDPVKRHVCGCCAESMILPADLAKALKGKP